MVTVTICVGGCLISRDTGENIWTKPVLAQAGDSPGVRGYLWAGRARGRGAGTGPASHPSLSCPPVTPSQGRTRVTCLKQF